MNSNLKKSNWNYPFVFLFPILFVPDSEFHSSPPDKRILNLISKMQHTSNEFQINKMQKSHFTFDFTQDSRTQTDTEAPNIVFLFNKTVRTFSLHSIYSFVQNYFKTYSKTRIFLFFIFFFSKCFYSPNAMTCSCTLGF